MSITTQNTFFLSRAKIELDAGVHLNTRKEEEGKEESAKLDDLDMQLNTYS
ncbi:hypothetical protein JW960_21360 [candidate division KSB1 bacterium]|nr:hypothetical protein [candidate division KSB1 bacterium]